MRGSIATPGLGTVRYGGNTSCVEIRNGDEIVILDAGTGLRLLGQSLLAEFKRQPLSLTLLISHTHWDHIQGLPFFAPIYDARCRLRILGGEGARKGLVAALTGQMESTYFPCRSPSCRAILRLKNCANSISPWEARSFVRTAPTIPDFASVTGCFHPTAWSVFSPTPNRGPAATTAR